MSPQYGPEISIFLFRKRAKDAHEKSVEAQGPPADEDDQKCLPARWTHQKFVHCE